MSKWKFQIVRLIFAVVSVYLRVDYCLNIVCSGGILLALLWFIFVWFIGSTSTTLFILGAFTGLVFSPIFPLSFGLINQRLNVIPLLLSLLLFTSSSSHGETSFLFILGFVMDANPNHFPTILIVCLIFSISLYVYRRSFIWFMKRNERKEKILRHWNPTKQIFKKNLSPMKKKKLSIICLAKNVKVIFLIVNHKPFLVVLFWTHFSPFYSRCCCCWSIFNELLSQFFVIRMVISIHMD